MAKDIAFFETHDVDLAAFLMLEGLKFIECRIDPSAVTIKPRVLIRFFDEKGKARDLERIFTGSQIKKYRDFHKYLLKEIHRSLKGL
jgi:hypothetical protein